MKKLLFVALAAIGMVACVQNEELAVNKSTAITFKQHVSNAASRVNDPSFTKDNLENFQVWGWMTTNAGTVFTGDVVSGSSASGWSYDNTQYWAPNRFYSFEAVAPANGGWTAVEETVADIKGLTFTNANGTEDLLYATYSVTTPDMATLVSGYDPVPLQFAHLLAKVQFSFKNTFAAESHTTINITNVKMSVPKAGSLDLDSKVWTINATEGNFDLAFGNAEATLEPSATAYTAAENALLTIPTDATAIYNITFDIEVIQGAEPAFNETLTSVISSKALEMGKAYNFKALIGPEVLQLQPIVFTVDTVEGWITGEEKELPLPAPVVVNDAAELAAALAAGKDYLLLAEDITYSTSYTLNKDVTIDLNGNSIVVSDPAQALNITSEATIENGHIKGKVYARSGSTITLNGVKLDGTINGGGSTEGLLQIQGGCNVYAKDCLFSATNSNTTKSRPLSIQATSSGTYVFENCEFKSNTNQNQVYVNSLSGTATLSFINCNFNNKTPNIMFADSCPLTNLSMTGTTKLSSVTLEINRAKDVVTDEDLAYMREMIANNSFSSVRVFYAGGSSEYIR